jgi:hypothetical protein
MSGESGAPAPLIGSAVCIVGAKVLCGVKCGARSMDGVPPKGESNEPRHHEGPMEADRR